MSTTTGHDPKTAILYARVSSDDQVRGYSLNQQMEALRAYCGREGYEVLGEERDEGWSGAYLERPGLDRVRDLVEEHAPGGVALVLAQDADRITRDPGHRAFLDDEFERLGTRLVALDDWGDDTHEGELLRFLKGWVSKGERLKIAERSRRGMLRKAREGKIILPPIPNYGFAANETCDGYVIDEEKMPVVRRIFRMIGEEACSINGVVQALAAEGVLTLTGKRRWSRTMIRNIIKDDVYKPHTHSEMVGLLSPEVAAGLDPERCYGVWWFNRRRVTQKQVVRKAEMDGRRTYRKVTKFAQRPPEEWIAVPVPDAGVPREIVESARAAIKDNSRPSAAGERSWELSGGVLRCGICGCSMRVRSAWNKKGGTRRYYYTCGKSNTDKTACHHRKNHRALDLEGEVWVHVSGTMKDPEQLREDLEHMIELERRSLRGDPDREGKAWLEKLSEVGRKRAAFQDMAAEGLITFDELRAKLADLEETRETAGRALATLRSAQEDIERLERDKATVLEHYAALAPEALDSLTPEERRGLYKMLRLVAFAYPDGTLEVEWEWEIPRGSTVCRDETTGTRFSRSRRRPPAWT
ncbi:MAG: recombinase family protein [Actinomycetota bacterium]|nr:recombinase family protein [Actinomycetota bacterium]